MVLYMVKKRGSKWRHYENMEIYKKVTPAKARVPIDSE